MRRPWPTGGCRAKDKQTNNHDIVRVIKSKRMGWTGYVACRKERVFVGKPHEHPCVDGRILLNWILKDTVWEGMDWIYMARVR
jgi:hypothetical protein